MLNVLIVIGLVLLGFIGLVIILFLAFAVCASRNVDKLLWGLPWLKWLTLDEIVEIGFSRFWSELLLPVFYKKGYLEIRASTELSKQEQEVIEVCGFTHSTVKFYEFKLTKRGGTRKQKRWKWIVPGWEPVPA